MNLTNQITLRKKVPRFMEVAAADSTVISGTINRAAHSPRLEMPMAANGKQGNLPPQPLSVPNHYNFDPY